MLEQWLLFAHVIGATVLFGTGAGIAFFMMMAHRTRDPRLIAHVAATVVVADTVFTATAAILQPATGALLARSIGWELSEGWITLSLLLYVVTGLFWLPVVRIQIRLRDLARMAAASGSALPPAYFRLYRIWFACGFPAFSAVVGILWLMLMKPAIALF
ncbi:MULTISPECIES: DUF2269 domain-containing protein [unclassified Rhizobium]|uniref:DUF2269 family protein n=1 Tax=unclassified Rhizobium TaxID=2613769 RepID=UPI001A99D317|nr:MULTISPECIES: DUF2269 domain-containing protein [unclassified Rhizobium]MBX5157843.1 DUF2269 domain-containing protein [Rhizobium sp. NZLR8]MBX5184830.1 DUF2269 domain-containing protein [Rhizobium sp. NZLR5]MBX5193037.1 DUF2269 domain-containing protein [Rhizobium sp. NZLR3b]MBX5195023.1 DUF2269 domain-containing protein [Rhizobium sp. NZLR10]MBX5204908.1 DUF2269 domain-containing protein [Rhizobium sp. NZLR1]